VCKGKHLQFTGYAFFYERVQAIGSHSLVGILPGPSVSLPAPKRLPEGGSAGGFLPQRCCIERVLLIPRRAGRSPGLQSVVEASVGQSVIHLQNHRLVGWLLASQGEETDLVLGQIDLAANQPVGPNHT